jgi:hypothetical protein
MISGHCGVDRLFKRILYVGDGGGDYCPATRMQRWDMIWAYANFLISLDVPSCDIICPRIGYPLHKKVMCGPIEVSAQSMPWTDGTDVLGSIRVFIAE